MKIKLTRPLVIKSAMVLFLVVYLARLYVSDYAADVSVDKISAALEQVENVTTLDEQGATGLRRSYQIEEDSTEGYYFRKAASPMAVEEVFVVKAASAADAESFLEAAQTHLENQKNVFEGYGTDQMALLNNALVGKKGNYVYYMCGADAASWRSAFLALI